MRSSGLAHPLEKCAFSREGYSFVGWATEQKGKVEYEDQTNIKLDKEFPNLKDDNDEVTLYAVWQEQSVTLESQKPLEEGMPESFREFEHRADKGYREEW